MRKSFYKQGTDNPGKKQLIEYRIKNAKERSHVHMEMIMTVIKRAL